MEVLRVADVKQKRRGPRGKDKDKASNSQQGAVHPHQGAGDCDPLYLCQQGLTPTMAVLPCSGGAGFSTANRRKAFEKDASLSLTIWSTFLTSVGAAKAQSNTSGVLRGPKGPGLTGTAPPFEASAPRLLHLTRPPARSIQLWLRWSSLVAAQCGTLSAQRV